MMKHGRDAKEGPWILGGGTERVILEADSGVTFLHSIGRVNSTESNCLDCSFKKDESSSSSSCPVFAAQDI